MDKFREGEDNPFDAPVAGQGLTDEPGNYPWEHPPQFTDTDEAADFVWDRLHRPEFAEQVLAMLDAGIPVEALGRIIIPNGFMEGKWNPDVAFIIAEPVMKMIATMGLTAGIEKIKMSMSDITNNEQIQSIVRTKVNAEETAEALGRIIIFNGFMEGKWNPDVAFIIAEPVMKMIATMGLTAGIEKIKMSMSDITNNEQIQSIVRTKVNAEETAEAAKGVKQDIKKIEKKGLMAKPNQEEME